MRLISTGHLARALVALGFALGWVGAPALGATFEVGTADAGYGRFQAASGVDGFGLGRALGAVDLDGDGRDELLVGAPGAPGAGGVAEAGALYLIRGASDSGAHPQLSGRRLPAELAPLLVIRGEASGDRLGERVLMLPDLDGDGRREVLVGGYFTSRGARAYLFTGATLAEMMAGAAPADPASEAPAQPAEASPAQADRVLVGDASSLSLGSALHAAPDLDGDGLEELILRDLDTTGWPDYRARLSVIGSKALGAALLGEGGEGGALPVAELAPLLTIHGPPRDATFGDGLAVFRHDGGAVILVGSPAFQLYDGAYQNGAVYRYDLRCGGAVPCDGAQALETADEDLALVGTSCSELGAALAALPSEDPTSFTALVSAPQISSGVCEAPANPGGAMLLWSAPVRPSLSPRPILVADGELPLIVDDAAGRVSHSLGSALLPLGGIGAGGGEWLLVADRGACVCQGLACADEAAETGEVFLVERRYMSSRVGSQQIFPLDLWARGQARPCFGAALASGDLNGNGMLDLVVAAPGSLTTYDAPGEVWILYDVSGTLDGDGDGYAPAPWLGRGEGLEHEYGVDDFDQAEVLGGDCDDADPRLYPAPEEAACDGVDEDCDQGVDEGLRQRWWPDLDGDGLGDPRGAVQLRCEGELDGWVTNADDCDDGDPAVERGAPLFPDADSDGFGDGSAPPADYSCAGQTRPGLSLNRGDCDDSDRGVNPAAVERCDGLDTSCRCLQGQVSCDDQGLPLDEADDDGDGVRRCDFETWRFSAKGPLSWDPGGCASCKTQNPFWALILLPLSRRRRRGRAS